jgi:hypothetical protein
MQKSPTFPIMRFISHFVPEGLSVSGLGSWASDEYMDSLKLVTASTDSVPTGLAVSIEAGPDDAMEALQAAAGWQIPLASQVYVTDFSDLYAHEHSSWSLTGYKRAAGELGFEIAVEISSPTAEGALFLLIPAGAADQSWWRARPVIDGIKRLRKKASRRAEKISEHGDSWRFQSEKWSDRGAVAAHFIPPGSRLMDLGCGAMHLSQSTAPSHYVPVDISPSDPRVRDLDLNAGPVPADWLDEVDYIACMGLFEYLGDPGILLAQCARHGKAMVCSYNVVEGRKSTRQINSWRNAFSTDEFESLMRAAGYTIRAREPFGKQFVWFLEPAPGN